MLEEGKRIYIQPRTAICHSEERPAPAVGQVSDEESLKRLVAEQEPQGFSPALAPERSTGASVAPFGRSE